MSIRADVQRYFEQFPNEKIYLKDLALAVEHGEKQVQAAISSMVRHEGYPLQVVRGGQCWIYAPTDNDKIGEKKIKVVGETSRGSLIIEVDDVLWIARKFEE